jgi:hypothetical protein
MSKVKIEGNASGTGTLTIAAPNTNTDRTLTLPDGAGEIVLADGSGDVALTGDITAVDATLSGGVYLGGTGSANYLDDYEEGVWTPVPAGSPSGNTGTADTAYGRYTKIGNTVHIFGYLANIDTSAISGNEFFIQGLPFSVDSASSQYPIGNVGCNSITFSGQIQAQARDGGSALGVTYFTSGGGWSILPKANISSGASDIWVSITYFIA